jgi:cell division septation protein DedD
MEEVAASPTAAFDENPPTPLTGGDYAEAIPVPPSAPERPSVFAQDSYTRNAGNTFVMATPNASNKGTLAKAFLIAALVFLLLGVAYVGLSGFVKDWFARRNQQATVTPGSAASNAGGTAPSVAPSVASKAGTETNGKKANPSASASVADSAKPSVAPAATVTPAANQSATSKPKPTPPQTGASGHAVGSSDGSLTLQIGSYKTADEAQARVAKLKAAGIEGRVVKADVPGKGTWYRVQTGRFTSEAEASKRANELRAQGATRDFIVTGYQNE